MQERDDARRRFSRGVARFPERTPATALTWAAGAVVLLLIGITLRTSWTIYLAVALWAGVAVVWWVRYRRFRAGQRD